MGNKKKRAHINPDVNEVKSVFQKNVGVAHKVKRIRKSDFVDRYDLKDIYLNRRIKAVVKLLPEMKKRYAEAYPQVNIAHEFAEIASLPVVTYDTIDRNSFMTLGAAFWMLDQYWADQTIADAAELLPDSYNGVDCIDVYDVRFHHSIFKKMLYVIQSRYGVNDRNVVPESIFDKRDENDAFHQLLAMLPEEAVNRAVANTKAKFWEWADLYFSALEPMINEYRRLDRSMDRLDDEMREYLVRKKKAPKLNLPLNSPVFPVMDDTVLERRLSDEEQMIQKMNRMEEEQDAVEQRMSNLRFMSLTAGINGRKELTECVGENLAERFCNFSIEDPYEICFAIIYLLDKDDDCAWAYSFMAAVACRAAGMLPWGQDTYVEMDDGFWFENEEWIKPNPLDPEWYETKFPGDPYDDEEADECHDLSLAQIVYQYTGAVLPRDMNRFDDAKRILHKKGLKPSQANMLCAMMDVIGEVSRQRFDFTKYADQDIWDDDDELLEMDEEISEADVLAENEKLKEEIKQLRKQAKEATYNLSRENRELKDKLEKADEQADKNAQELADLREIVFNQQTKGTEEKQEDTKIKFPYRTTRRLIAFGGHDSFLREIKFKLPDVRFVGEDISSPEIIRRADVVWIQTNCIGHKSYYNIIDLARKYGRKVRYFKYASATKCAEQVVEEEENAEDRR